MRTLGRDTYLRKRRDDSKSEACQSGSRGSLLRRDCHGRPVDGCCCCCEHSGGCVLKCLRTIRKGTISRLLRRRLRRVHPPYRRPSRPASAGSARPQEGDGGFAPGISEPSFVCVSQIRSRHLRALLRVCKSKSLLYLHTGYADVAGDAPISIYRSTSFCTQSKSSIGCIRDGPPQALATCGHRTNADCFAQRPVVATGHSARRRGHDKVQNDDQPNEQQDCAEQEMWSAFSCLAGRRWRAYRAL